MKNGDKFSFVFSTSSLLLKTHESHLMQVIRFRKNRNSEFQAQVKGHQ
jgi:hypothetical protein